MSGLKVGDAFPENVVFKHVPWTTEDPKACGIPQDLNASREWADKKVVIVSVPGAFTPGCQGTHIPPYIEKFSELKSKGIDKVAVIAYNDAWVMSAWGKINMVTGDDILFLADTESKFAEKIGWYMKDMGRNQRFAIVVDHGKVTYAEVEKGREIGVSSADAVLSKL